MDPEGPEVPIIERGHHDDPVLDEFLVHTEFQNFVSETQDIFQLVTDRMAGIEQTLQQLKEMLVGRFASTLVTTNQEERATVSKVPTPSEAARGEPSASERVRIAAKDLQNLSFSGEEKEMTKDTVVVFLANWTDYHELTGTRDHLRPTETGLFLRGKASRWCLSLAEPGLRPETWKDFQDLFRKEYLPENELLRNWSKWDDCRMGSLTLAQYLSNYREAMLRLPMDHFQRWRGFIRGDKP